MVSAVLKEFQVKDVDVYFQAEFLHEPSPSKKYIMFFSLCYTR